MNTITRLFGLFTLIWAIVAVNLCSVSGQGFLTNGLIAYYPFNGNADDASGNGNNGTVSGAVLTQDRFGESAAAYAFNGSNSFISANIPNLPTVATPRTVSLWAAANPEPFGVNLFFWGTNAVNRGFGLMNNGSPYTWYAQAWGDDVSSGVVVDTNWHHVVVVYAGTTLSIAIDGVQKAVGSSALNTPFSSLLIGEGMPGDGTKFFRGTIDDVRIYNRALSTQEISQLYQYESAPWVSLVKAVKPSFSHMAAGTNYQLQVSGDLSTWTNQGTPFTATNSSMIYPQYFDVDNWNSLFFRLQVSP
jgi:hypothetical protein